MGYTSTISGTVKFNRPLTKAEAIEFLQFCTSSPNTGREDWTLTEQLDGIMCSWESSFKAYDTFEALKLLLATLPADVRANGFFKEEGQSNEDISLWRVTDNALQPLGATILFDLEAFAAAVHAAVDTNPCLHVGSAVLATFKSWEEPEPEDGDRLDAYDFLAAAEEEKEEDDD